MSLGTRRMMIALPHEPRRVTARPGVILFLCLVLISAGPVRATLLPNGDFGTAHGPLPANWNFEPVVREKGQARLVEDTTQAGRRLLELRPNRSNGGDRPLALGQLLDARPLRGQRLQLSGVLGAQDGAVAIVGLHVLGKSGDLGNVQLQYDGTDGSLKVQQATLAVPATAEHVIIYAAAGGTEGRALFGSLTLTPIAMTAGVPAATATAAHGAAHGAAMRVRVTVETGSAVRVVPAALFGTNVEWIFDGQGLWQPARNRLDPDAVAQARELGITLLRWPGGVFADHYHWRDGIGPMASRPTSKHYVGGPSSRHSFGTGEASTLAAALKADLMVTVNVGTGSADEAADWVRYHNRDTGQRVNIWEVGNELYMKGDLSGGHMSAETYAQRFLAYAQAMRAVDPSISVGAIGGLNYGRFRFIDDSRWTEKLLRAAAPQIDFLAIHNAYAPVMIGASDKTDVRAAYRAMLAAPRLIEANLRDVSALLAKHEAPGRRIGIAITEWGPFFHILPTSPWVDHVKTMGSALFTASTLNVFLREPRVDIANFFKLADQGFMGWLGRRAGAWVPTPSAQVFTLYSRLSGQTLLTTRTEGPAFSSQALGVVDAVRDAPEVDAVGARAGADVTLLLVNRSETDAADVTVELRGARGWRMMQVETISASGYDAHGGTELPVIPGLRWAEQVSLGRFEKGAPTEIRRSRETLPASNVGGTLQRRLLPMSVTSIVLRDVQR